MKDIETLQNIKLNRAKLSEVLQGTKTAELKQLLNVGAGQIGWLRKGERSPSASGLLRLMLRYGLKPKDLAITE